ncbi:MAG: integrase [Rubritepida sp.]|nr:integrase [Rubritepida sp.]
MPKLTDRFILAFAPAEGAKDRLTFDTEVKGLGLRATSSGTKTFIVQWTDKATARKVREPIGVWGAITLEQAREAARIRLGRVAAGFNPKAERTARAAEEAKQREEVAQAKIDAAFTLEALIDDWARLHLSSRRPRYSAEAQRALRLTFKAQLGRSAATLRHDAVIAALDNLVGEGKAATARLTMAYGRSCYGWAVKRRRLVLNPFAGLPAIEGSSTSRDRVLSDEEIGQAWRAAVKVPAPHGPLVRFLLLTLARRDEGARMTWGEIAADLSTWTQPGERTKNGKPHVVHLADPAKAILRELLGVPERKPLPALPPASQLIFGLARNRPITAFSWIKREMEAAIAAELEMRPTRADRTASALAAWVLHDFRRSGVTWLAGAGFPPHVADRLLNHVGGTISGVAAVYQRGEFLAERKAALDAWAVHVVACAGGREATPKVTSLDSERKRRRAR